jgi:hypothetical protein
MALLKTMAWWEKHWGSFCFFFCGLCLDPFFQVFLVCQFFFLLPLLVGSTLTYRSINLFEYHTGRVKRSSGYNDRRSLHDSEGLRTRLVIRQVRTEEGGVNSLENGF